MSAPQATPCPECSQHPGRVPYHDIDGNFADWVQCRCAAPAAEPDNLVARLRATVALTATGNAVLAEAADRIEALEADAHSFGDRLADATEARDAALTKVTELEAENQRFAEYLDAISENYDRMERERDAALARANEEAALADQLHEALLLMSHNDDPYNAVTPALAAWRARRSQETP